MVVDLIFVPQGAEYRAVVKGLERWQGRRPTVMTVPMGPGAVTKQLQQQIQSELLPALNHQRVLLMGLAGGVTAEYAVGDVLVLNRMVMPQSPVIKQDDCDPLGFDCPDIEEYECDRLLTMDLYHHLQQQRPIVPCQIGLGQGVTSDRLITTAVAKQHLGQCYKASCVEMEGTRFLAAMHSLGAKAAIVRVISDDAHTDIPDLGAAIDPNGNLKLGPLLWILGRHPLAAMRLIRGSLTGLKRLRQVAQWLDQTEEP